jgi:hypothetical protein
MITAMLDAINQSDLHDSKENIQNEILVEKQNTYYIIFKILLIGDPYVGKTNIITQ